VDSFKIELTPETAIILRAWIGDMPSEPSFSVSVAGSVHKALGELWRELHPKIVYNSRLSSEEIAAFKDEIEKTRPGGIVPLPPGVNFVDTKAWD